MEVSEGGSRLLLRLGVGAAGLVGLSGTAVAHGPRGAGGDPVAFAVVLGLPAVAGLGGGVLAMGGLRVARTAPTGHKLGAVLGVWLAVLGVAFAVSAVTTSRALGLAGGAVGVISALWVSRSDGLSIGGCHADLALGAVSAHRLLEGLALGALYSAGAAIGLLGAVLLAGHVALETAAVGGMYASSDARTRAIGGILLVQAGYAAGAVVGLGVAWALPAWVRALALAAAGGALLIVGADEAWRAIGEGVGSRPAAT